MDTTTIHTVINDTIRVVTKVNLIHSIQGALEPLNWFLLYLGLLMYWLNKLNAKRQEVNGVDFLTAFWKDNIIEIPSSIAACLVLAIISQSISTDLLDMHGSLSIFMVGYSSSSVLNGLITAAKKK